jgi:hypothetical protein
VDDMLLILSFLPFCVILLLLSLRRVSCPDCGDRLPFVQSPVTKTRRQWIAGGYLCQRCVCETNMAGQKVTADTPPARFPIHQWALLAVLLLIGGGLVTSLILVGQSTVEAPRVLEPLAVLVLPQEAPALVPIK